MLPGRLFVLAATVCTYFRNEPAVSYHSEGMGLAPELDMGRLNPPNKVRPVSILGHEAVWSMSYCVHNSCHASALHANSMQLSLSVCF